MADKDPTIRITGKDDTAPAIKSATAGFKALNKEVQAMFKETEAKTLVSINQLAHRSGEQFKLFGGQRIKHAEETSRAYAGIIQKDIAKSNLWAQELNRQNVEAAKSGKTFVESEKVKSKAVDDTAKAVQKTGKTYVASNETLRKYYTDTKNAAAEQGKAAAAGGQAAAQGQSKHAQAIQSVAAGLGRMAVGYMSVSKAIDITKQSFMGFAEFDNKMRLMKGALGATTKEAREYEETIRYTARKTAESSAEIYDAFKTLADTAQIPMDQAKKIFPQIALMAKGAGVAPKAMARSVADVLRNLEIAPEQAGEAMEIMSAGARHLSVDIDKIGPHMSELTTYMTDLGYSGTEALVQIEAIMASLNKTTGDTGESAALFERLMQNLGASAKDLGFASQESMMRAIKGTENPIATVIELIRTATDQEAVLGNMSVKQRAAIKRLLADDNKAIVGDNVKMLRELQKGSEGAKVAKDVLSGPLQEINKLMEIMSQLGDQYGQLLDDFGATTAIKSIATQLDSLRRTLKQLHELWNWAFRGGEKPKPRYSEEEREDMKQEHFYEKLPPIAKPLGEWITKGLQGPFGLWGPLYNKDYDKDGEEPPAAPTPPEGSPASPAQQERQYRGLGEKVHYLNEEFDTTAEKLRQFTALLPDSDDEGVRAFKASVGGLGTATGISPVGYWGGGRSALAPAHMTAGTGAGVYGTSTDAKYLNASYVPGAHGGVGGYGPGGYGPSQGVGSGGTPEQAGPGTGGTGYGGGTRPQPGYTAPRRGDGTVPAAGADEAPATDPSTTGATGGAVTGDQGAQTPQSDRGRIAMAKAAMKDEAIRQGIDPARAEEAANLMAGQGLSESELKPGTLHDRDRYGNPTGHGIYGARLGRRDAMHKWLKDNGYDKNSLAGQSRYMMKEALSKDSRGRYKYPKTAAALKSADPATRAQAVRTLTKEFEAPADQGEGQMNRRLGRTRQAAGVAAGGLPTAPPPSSDGVPVPPGVTAQAGTSAPVLPPELRPPGGGAAIEPGVAGAAGGAGAPAVGNLVEEAQGRVAGIRKGRLDPRLRDALEGAAEASGVKIRVTSGGQRMEGAHGHTGSHRHDKGRAADVDVIDPKTNKVLPLSDPRRLKVLEEAARRGAGGSGARYMDDPNKIHMGITGNKAIVGEGLGAYAGTAEERAAVQRGLNTRLTPEQMRAEREARSNRNKPAPVAAPAPAPAAPAPAPPETRPPVDSGAIMSQNRDINMNVNVNSSQVQFARNTIDRQVHASMDRTRGATYHDIGTA
jgi:hypothetical protein